MLVSDRHQLVFMHIPKCAGTSVRNALMPFDERRTIYFDRSVSEHPDLGMLDYAHIPLKTLQKYFESDFERVRAYESFAVTRDPFRRFSSALFQRVLMYGEKKPHELTSREVKIEVEKAIEHLSGYSDTDVVIRPKYIHFSRQVDYIYLDGEKLIDRVYPVGDMARLLSDISEIVGAPVPADQELNKRSEYTNGYLRELVIRARPALSVLPGKIRKNASSRFRAQAARLGMVGSWHEAHRNVFESEYVRSFISEFYREDLRLYADCCEKSKVSSTTTPK